MRLKDPGFYALPDNEYFADPAPKPSLTQSLAKILLERSPRHMWYAHPRLNKRWEDDRAKKWDLGHVAHALLFGPGRPIHIVDAPDWRTKAAQQERDKAIDSGQQPVLVSVYERAKNMADQFRLDSDLMAIDGAGCEITALALCEAVWLRTKLDWVSREYDLIVDYKTTQRELKRDDVPRYAWAHGWHLQAAMHERILDKLKPDKLGRRMHYFMLQEAYPPYASYKCRLSESLMQIGRDQITRAIHQFRLCLDTDEWPGPCNQELDLMAPSWAIHESMFQPEEVAHD